VAIGGLPEAGEWSSARVIRALGDVLNNPWESTKIEKIDAVLSVQYTRDLWRLRGVELLDEVVDAGDKARMILHLRPFAGPEVTKTVEVRMPVEVAGKDVEVEIVPGYEISPELAAPENLNELLANEPRQSGAPRSMVIQFRVPSQGVTYRGHVAPLLPDFALDALRPAHASVGPEAYLSYSRTVVPVDRYVEGRDKVKIKVRPVVR
jgi:hypothetical protein